jgi:Raf kinase inhibitor-like YbhB/YbcL family protein
MKLWSHSFADHSPIPGEFAFAVTDPASHIALSTNRNPHFAWSELPAGTQSLALICHDPDVPSVGDDVNQAGRTLPDSLPRVHFYHWVLVDLLPGISEIHAGEYSRQVTAGGKPGPGLPNGARQGLNDYTGWFAGDETMAGDYFGYDGPCPPWNDERIHRYVFTLYALDLPMLPVQGKFSGVDALQAMVGHMLAQASVTGLYSLNQRLAHKLGVDAGR